ncbi:MAG: glycosyltransferase [Sphingomicrobium sp.]
MKITHVVPALTKGGGERVAMDLANHAADCGHEVTILTAVPSDSVAPVERRPGVELRYIYPRGRSRIGRYASLPTWLVRNRRWLAEQDIVHCHMTFASVTGTLVQLARTVFRQDRPAVIETCHSVGAPIPRLHQRLYAFLAAPKDGVALIAEDVSWTGLRRRRGDRPVAIIRNGVAFAPQIERRGSGVANYRRRVGIPDSCDIVVGTVGRIAADRRPSLYIPVIADIAAAIGPNVHFIMGGAGPEFENMQAAVREVGLGDRVHFPGLVLDPVLAMSAMDLYLTMNIGAVTGIAAIEAAAAGTPVVAIQMAPDRERQDDDWIWSSSDPRAVAAHAIGLLRSGEQRLALAQQQQAYARSHHGVDAMARAYYELYDRIRVKESGNVAAE